MHTAERKNRRNVSPMTSNFLKIGSLTLFLLLTGLAGSAFSVAVRIMPLGDSITVGESSGVADPADWISYRKALFDRLAAGRYFTNFVGGEDNGAGVAGFTDTQHEGHGGWVADGVAGSSILPAVKGFLTTNPADIVLLHIGTNDISSGQPPVEIRNEVNGILNEIDEYEQSTGRNVWVVLALIVNRATGNALRDETTDLNNRLDLLATSRRNNGDKIVVVDMENAIDDYDKFPYGEMFDDIHPYATGYTKMAQAWYQELIGILPTANAGVDKSVNPGATVSLDGGGSTDLLGTITTYAWTQTAGSPIVDFDIPAAKVAKFTAPGVSGGTTLTFKLTITDDKDFSHNDQVQVTVNGPPRAVAGADQQVNANATVTLDATASSDPGGAIASYQWVQTPGSPVVSLAGANTTKASFTAPEPGSSGGTDLVFKLTVTDNKGAIAEDTLVVHVNGPPVADAGLDQQVKPGAVVILDGTRSSDGDGAIGAYRWVQTSGPAVVLSDSTSSQPSFTAPASGASVVLTFELTVTDSLARQSTDSSIVTVVPEPDPIVPDGGGAGADSGGGGGGGCFITAAGM